MSDSRKKAKTIKDPNAALEAEKYENPVPSREALLLLLEDAPGPLTHPQVCETLGEEDEGRIEALRRRLIAMCRDGQLISNRRNQFMSMKKADLVRGTVMGHRDGFGFVLRDDGDDVYLSNSQMRCVFHGDKVAVQILGLDRRGRPEGKIVEVLEQNTTKVVGRYFEESGVGVVQPDNKRIPMEVLIPKDGRMGAAHGQFVVAMITRQPAKKALPMGEIVEVLGEHLAPGMEIDVAIRSHNIPHEWPEEVTVEAEAIPAEVTEADKQHRIDLRDMPFVTIDGEDARDFDDAVFCERNKSTGGWRLWVAIADVSNYVQVNAPLDKEAHLRATSVYFPGSVIPMLPEKLSNGLCSLNPHLDRLTMVCEMTISKAGRVSGYKFMEGIIHSHARLTYNKVWDMINPAGDKDVQEQWRDQYSDVVPHVDELYRLYKILREQREVRGAMDFDSVETRIVFDSERKIQEIVPTERNHAHMLIEECMLAANVCAADFFSRYEIPALYRVHKGPSAEKLENLGSFLTEMGLTMPNGKDPKPSDYQTLLQQIENRPDSHLIQTVLLRSLSQAKYEPENQGHFGLAYKAYTHFTSPIRRYPDLLVHRGIRSVIRSDRECKHVQRAEGATPMSKRIIYPYDLQAMVVMGEHCSMAERRADDATRDVTDFLKCEFIRDRVGGDFEGTISAVTGFGLFVELKNIYVEGLVHVSTLQNDYYQFDAIKHRLVGERTRRSFRLGDTIWVRVVGVDLDDRKVNFELTTAPMNADKKPEAGDATAPARAPRKRGKGTTKEELLKPTRKPSSKSKTGGKKGGAGKATTGTAVQPGAKPAGKKDGAPAAKSTKRKPSKRQKLNAAGAKPANKSPRKKS